MDGYKKFVRNGSETLAKHPANLVIFRLDKAHNNDLNDENLKIGIDRNEISNFDSHR